LPDARPASPRRVAGGRSRGARRDRAAPAPGARPARARARPWPREARRAARSGCDAPRVAHRRGHRRGSHPRLGRCAGLGEDLGGDLLVAADRSVRSRGGELRAVDRDHGDVDDPGLRAEPQDLAEEAPRAYSWRTRKRAIVAWSGAWLAQITRKATSSRQRRSIPRGERSPTA